MKKIDPAPEFNIPKKFETILSLLSAYYGQKNKHLLQNLIVNSTYHIKEGVEPPQDRIYPEYGHTVHFQVPQILYTEILSDITTIEESLRTDLNQFVSGSSVYEGEYISRVYFDLSQDQEILNWRNESGLLFQNSTLALIKNEAELDRIWGKGFFKVFLSHKSKNKKIAAQLKTKLFSYGISCFVAHEDIKPTKKWQDEMEKALSTADALVPLLINGFHESKWTDQEIGIAIGRGIPIFPVRFDIDPYGFIGKYQAITFKDKVEGYEGREVDYLALSLFQLMLENPITKERIIDSMVTKIETSASFDQTNYMMRYISKLEKLPVPLIDRLEQAYQHNSQVNGAFNAEERLPSLITKWRHNNK